METILSTTILQWVNTAIIVIGIPVIVGVLVNIGRKLQTLDSLQDEVNNKMRPDLKDIRERFAALEARTMSAKR